MPTPRRRATGPRSTRWPTTSRSRWRSPPGGCGAPPPAGGDGAAPAGGADAFPSPRGTPAGGLRRALADREPIEAAWRLRDAFECLIKFAASLAIADCLADRPDPATAVELVGTLF